MNANTELIIIFIVIIDLKVERSVTSRRSTVRHVRLFLLSLRYDAIWNIYMYA